MTIADRLLDEASGRPEGKRLLAILLLSLGTEINGGKSMERFAEISRDQAQLVATAYAQRRIGPRTYAPFLVLLKYLDLLREIDIDKKTYIHVMIVICQAIQHVLDGEDSYFAEPACLLALRQTPFRPLMPAWKALIEFCFTDYRVHRDRLVSDSTSEERWDELLRALLPRLTLHHYPPIFDVTYSDRLQLPEGIDLGQVNAALSNQVKTPLPLYVRLFSADDLKRHAEEDKMIEETYANTFAAIMARDYFAPNYFRHIATEVADVAKAEGAFKARLKVTELHQLRLSIPQYFANELKQRYAG